MLVFSALLLVLGAHAATPKVHAGWPARRAALRRKGVGAARRGAAPSRPRVGSPARLHRAKATAHLRGKTRKELPGEAAAAHGSAESFGLTSKLTGALQTLNLGAAEGGGADAVQRANERARKPFLKEMSPGEAAALPKEVRLANFTVSPERKEEFLMKCEEILGFASKSVYPTYHREQVHMGVQRACGSMGLEPDWSCEKDQEIIWDDLQGKEPDDAGAAKAYCEDTFAHFELKLAAKRTSGAAAASKTALGEASKDLQHAQERAEKAKDEVARTAKLRQRQLVGLKRARAKWGGGSPPDVTPQAMAEAEARGYTPKPGGGGWMVAPKPLRMAAKRFATAKGAHLKAQKEQSEANEKLTEAETKVEPLFSAHDEAKSRYSKAKARLRAAPWTT